MDRQAGSEKAEAWLPGGALVRQRQQATRPRIRVAICFAARANVDAGQSSG